MMTTRRLDKIKDIPLLWTMFMFIGLMFTSCHDSPEINEEEPTEMSYEECIYRSLVGNFYDVVPNVEYFEHGDSTVLFDDGEDTHVYEPSVGVNFNEANLYERTEHSETYEDAVSKFINNITVSSDIKSFMDSTENKITLSLGAYGTVSLQRVANDGIMAKADVNLKDLHPYSILYKEQSAFDCNWEEMMELTSEYSPGDIVEFKCENCSRDEETRKGFVINVSNLYIQIVTDHLHFYSKKDSWKKVSFYYNVASFADWQAIVTSWSLYHESFEESSKYLPPEDDWINFSIVQDFINLMNGRTPKGHEDRVCVEGNDIGLHTHKWKGLIEDCIWSSAYWILVSSFNGGYFNVKEASDWGRYAFHDGINHAGMYLFYRLVKIDYRDVKTRKLRRLYPTS